MRNNKLFTIFFLLVLGFFFTFGCSATKRIKDDVLGGDRSIKRKIAFFTGKNLSGRGGQKLGPLMSTTLRKHITDHCSDIVVLDSSEVQQRLSRVPLLPSGHRDNFTLAQEGRVLGLNAVFESILHDIWFTWEKRGIWGFRDEVPIMKVTLGIKAYDIETTATLVNEVFLEEVDLSDSGYTEGGDLAKHSEGLVKAALTQVLSRVAKQVSKGLAEVSWKGFVVAVEGEHYVISAGQDVGLKESHMLEVLQMGEPIEGVGGEFFIVPGPVIGVLRITEVRPASAVAAVVSGDDDFQKSCSVQIKKE